MKTYATRANAKRAGTQAGINVPDISVLEVSRKNFRELGVEEGQIGRYVYLDAGEKRRQQEVEQTIAELDKEQAEEGLNELFDKHGTVDMTEIKKRIVDDLNHNTDADEVIEDLTGKAEEIMDEAVREVLEERDNTDDEPTDEALEDQGDEPVNTLKANRSQSTIEKPVAYVHAKADEMVAEAIANGAPPPRRKDVVNACIEDGVAHHTARTQYQVWFKKQRAKNMGAKVPPAHLDHDAGQ